MYKYGSTPWTCRQTLDPAKMEQNMIHWKADNDKNLFAWRSWTKYSNYWNFLNFHPSVCWVTDVQSTYWVRHIIVSGYKSYWNSSFNFSDFFRWHYFGWIPISKLLKTKFKWIKATPTINSCLPSRFRFVNETKPTLSSGWYTYFILEQCLKCSNLIQPETNGTISNKRFQFESKWEGLKQRD